MDGLLDEIIFTNGLQGIEQAFTTTESRACSFFGNNKGPVVLWETVLKNLLKIVRSRCYYEIAEHFVQTVQLKY